MRLGCKEHDPAAAAALPQVRLGAVPVLPSVMPDLSWTPTLGRNDVAPTCVQVAYANGTRASMRYFGGGDIVVPDEAILRLFDDANGMPGATWAQVEATDGSDPLAVMACAQTHGWDVGLQAPLVPSYGVGESRQDSIARTIGDVGTVMLAVTLYSNDMQAQANGQPWTDAPAGSVEGGHMIAACGYAGLGATDPLSIATWGTWQPAWWGWLMPRLRLVVPVLTRDLLPPAAASRYAALAAEVGAA